MSSEHRAFLGFVIFLVLFAGCVAGPLLLSPAAVPLTSRTAGVGGLIALLGVILIARPVWRIGPWNWFLLHLQDMANVVYADIDRSLLTTKKDESEEALRARLEDKMEKLDDQFNQQFLGPILVGMGTVINGFSGYNF